MAKCARWGWCSVGEVCDKASFIVDDLVLISKSAHGLQMHLYALEHFCREVGMQVNISKTKIMISSNERKQIHHTFFFEGKVFEEVNEYKYLGIDFNNKLNWEDFRKKRILGGWKSLYALQNRCREVELRDWKMIKCFLDS